VASGGGGGSGGGQLNVDHLRAGLTEYRTVLERQSLQILSEFGEINRLFAGLFSVYDGEHARSLRHDWQKTADWFDSWIQSTGVVTEFLRHRTVHLQEL
jgi:hypothetical protein